MYKKLAYYVVVALVAMFVFYKYHYQATNNIDQALGYIHQASSSEHSRSQNDVSVELKNYQKYFNFKTSKAAEDHFNKHRGEFNYRTVDEYIEGANRVIQNPNALFKLEKEDGDYIYFLEDTNEIVFISSFTDRNNQHYLRTYFRPSSGIRYFNKQ